MNAYRDFISHLAKTQSSQFFLNSDEDKMLSVFVTMFNNADTIFRILAENLCNDTTNHSEYIQAVSNFLERGGKLEILLTNYSEDKAKDSDLFKRLYYYKKNNKDIVVKATSNGILYDGKDAHVAIADNNAFRIETDTQTRKAICNMNMPDFAKVLDGHFDTAYDDKENTVINLVKLFE